MLALIKRLETVATKLEKSAPGSATSALINQVSALAAVSNVSAENIGKLTRAVEAVEAAGMRNGTSSSSTGSAGPSSASLIAYDDIVNGPFKTYLDLSKRIGSEVATIGEMVEAAFKAHRAYLEMASKAKKPSPGDLPTLQKPMGDKINEIQTYREAGRRCQFFNHLSAISESIPALGWINMSPTPAPFVKEMNDAGMFYTNRVLKDWKDKSKAHVEWTKAWIQTLTQLQGWVKEFHTTGLVWNAQGVEAKTIMNQGSAAPPPPAGGPPPPPPPPPADLFDDLKITENAEDKARNALFDELNKGDDVTKGLKKVTADMQTHKNPNLRGGSTVPAGAIKSGSPKPASGAKPAAQAPAKPPKLELEGKKWAVEYFKGNPNLVVEGTETNQSIYVYRCENSTLKVEGKVNNIVVDGCKKLAVVFDNVVSSCEFINCQSVQMQVLGKVPTISIDKTDGCQMFLSKESLQTEIITAKSSEMNVMIPNGDEFVEQPVPEQFKTVVKGIKLSTACTESV